MRSFSAPDVLKYLLPGAIVAGMTACLVLVFLPEGSFKIATTVDPVNSAILVLFAIGAGYIVSLLGPQRTRLLTAKKAIEGHYAVLALQRPGKWLPMPFWNEVVQKVKRTSRLQIGPKDLRGKSKTSENLRWAIFHYCDEYVLARGGSPTVNGNRGTFELLRNLGLALQISAMAGVLLLFASLSVLALDESNKIPAHDVETTLAGIAVGIMSPFFSILDKQIVREQERHAMIRHASSVYEAYLAAEEAK